MIYSTEASDFELTNEQREYFGLDAIDASWEKVVLPGDRYRAPTTLYFDGDIIRRHIISTEREYRELHYSEPTRNRQILLPKTSRGKEQKLTASTLESRKPSGVYLDVTESWGLKLASFDTQTTFFSSAWLRYEALPVQDQVAAFIAECTADHFGDLARFKKAKRQHKKFGSGDYFCFKINRTDYAFGRVLLDIHKIREAGVVPAEHGLCMIMMRPVLVQLFAFISKSKNVSLETLDSQPKLPSSYMGDNLLFYGEYEVIGNRRIGESEFDYPISYGRHTQHGRDVVFLQWGLIHAELPLDRFDRYSQGETPFELAPYRFNSIGFNPHYGAKDVLSTVASGGKFDFNDCRHFAAKGDLRNPANYAAKQEIFAAFGLDADASYDETRRRMRIPTTREVIDTLS